MLLALDTSSRACSCAVFDGAKLVAEGYLNGGLTHSATLTMLVENTLSTARLKFADIDCIAVSAGPGSYTGLRIGLAAAKGMAMGRNIPCIAVSTLMALAYNLTMFQGAVCAALDARAGQVYAAMFEAKDGNITRLTEDKAMTLSELGEILTEGAAVCGDGAALVQRSFPEKKLVMPPDSLVYQRASSVALLALTEKYEPVPAAQLEALYHRKSQAEREREAKDKNQGGN